MRVLIIPAAGRGQRFRDAGYDLPKPLIPLPFHGHDVAMIRAAASPFNGHVDRVVLLVPPDRAFDRYKGHSPEDRPQVFLSRVDTITEGAAVTTLAAAGRVPPDAEVFIANSDQLFLGADPLAGWLHHIGLVAPEGSVLTFAPRTPGDKRWSYVAPLGTEPKEGQPWGHVSQVVEKVPLSRLATCGVYYFRSFKIMLRSIAQMIALDDRTNGEFYLAPAFSQLATRSPRGVTWFTAPEGSFRSVGTPELLAAYIDEVRGAPAAAVAAG